MKPERRLTVPGVPLPTNGDLIQRMWRDRYGRDTLQGAVGLHIAFHYGPNPHTDIYVFEAGADYAEPYHTDIWRLVAMVVQGLTGQAYSSQKQIISITATKRRD